MESGGEQQQLADLLYTSTEAADAPDELRLRFSRLHMEWNPETINALIAFARLPPAPPPASRAASARRCSSTAMASSESVYLDATESLAMSTSGGAPLAAGLSASQHQGSMSASSAAASVYLDARSEYGDAEGGGGGSLLMDEVAGSRGGGGGGGASVSPSKAEGHADGEEETRSDLIVVAELQSLSMSLNAERTGERLGIMAMKELGMNIRWPAGSGMTVSGQLGNLTIQDTLTVPSSPYEMLGLRPNTESSLLTFEYVSPSDEERESLRANGDYDHSLKLRMSSVQVSYWHPAIMRTYHYLQSGLIGALVDRAAEKVKQMARSVFLSAMIEEDISALSLDFEIGSPIFLLATEPGGAVGLRADLGRLGVRNTLLRRREAEGRTFGAVGVERDVTLDSIKLTLEQMHIDSIGADAQAGTNGGAGVAADTPAAAMARAFQSSGVRMLRDAALEVVFERGVGTSADRAMTVVGRGAELSMDCSNLQYELSLRVLRLNLASQDRQTVGGGQPQQEQQQQQQQQQQALASREASPLLARPAAQGGGGGGQGGQGGQGGRWPTRPLRAQARSRSVHGLSSGAQCFGWPTAPARCSLPGCVSSRSR